MNIQIFSIPIMDDGSAQAELNKFLNSNKILEIDKYFYQNEKGAIWCFCLRYLAKGNSAFSSGFGKKVDYKELLEEKQFTVFSRLREIRKELATKDAVPAYAVFTDAELAEISKMPTLSANDMKQLKGIAEKRMEKYGNALVTTYNTLIGNEKT